MASRPSSVRARSSCIASTTSCSPRSQAWRRLRCVTPLTSRPLGVESDVNRRRRGGRQVLVTAGPRRFDERAVEVHVNQAFVHLHHAVLQPGGDVQLLRLDAQRERRLLRLGQLDFVKPHQRPQRGDDDCARPAEADEPRDVGGVGKREVRPTGQIDVLLAAVVVEAFDASLHQPQTAVVAHELGVAEEVGDGLEAAQIRVAGPDLEAVGFLQRDRRGEVAEGEADRFAEVAVGGVADESGAGVGLGGDAAHCGWPKSYRIAPPSPRQATGASAAGSSLLRKTYRAPYLRATLNRCCVGSASYRSRICCWAVR